MEGLLQEMHGFGVWTTPFLHRGLVWIFRTGAEAGRGECRQGKVTFKCLLLVLIIDGVSYGMLVMRRHGFETPIYTLFLNVLYAPCWS